MKMFDNYNNLDPNYIPDNKIKCLCFDILDEIVVHGTAKHTFKLNFPYSLVQDFKIYYKQSIEGTCITKAANECVITEKDDNTFIEVKLSPDETNKFDAHRETFTQIKITLTNGEVIFGEKNKIKVTDTLCASEETPTEDVEYIEAEMSDLYKLI